jgi:tetrahydromethanopterin S-methyltransferase subunit G
VVETGLAKAQEAEEPDVPIPQTSILMATAIAGGLIGVAVVLVWEPYWKDFQKSLANSGPFVLWVALTVAQAMLWAAALPSLVVILLRHWRLRRPDSVRREVVPSAVVFVLALAAFAVVPHFTRTLHTVPEDLIPGVAYRIGVLTVLGGLVALAAATSIWLIRGRVEALETGRKLTGGELRTYLGLRSDLERLLGFLGAVIGLGVLTVAALRQVVVQEYNHHLRLVKDPLVKFPPEVLILYGVVLTLIVALVYLPTWATMQQTGSMMRDGVAPLPEPTSDQLEAQLQKRAALDDLLGLRVSASTSFKAGVAILSPLLASLTSLLPK